LQEAAAKFSLPRERQCMLATAKREKQSLENNVLVSKAYLCHSTSSRKTAKEFAGRRKLGRI
jgi:hypothetical protein